MSFFLIFHKIFYKKQINEYFAEEEFVLTILVNSVNKQMLKRIRNDKQNAVTLNLFQGFVDRYFATFSMT